MSSRLRGAVVLLLASLGPGLGLPLDAMAGSTERVSVGPDGSPLAGRLTAMSPDGRFVVFERAP